MKVRIYAIAKKDDFCNDYGKAVRQFGVNVEEIDIFNATIQKAHKISPKSAQDAYGEEFSKYLSDKCPNIALDINGTAVNTSDFSRILEHKTMINFFIGGAYGLGKEFLAKTQNISLSALTLSHKVAKLVLLEQIFRALCIIHNHPYHKE